MTHRVLAAELPKYINQSVKLSGWLNNIRTFGKLSFLILRDRSGFSQIVIDDKEELSKISQLQPGIYILIYASESVKMQQRLVIR